MPSESLKTSAGESDREILVSRSSCSSFLFFTLTTFRVFFFFFVIKSNKQTTWFDKLSAGFSASDEIPADKLSMVE